MTKLLPVGLAGKEIKQREETVRTRMSGSAIRTRTKSGHVMTRSDDSIKVRAVLALDCGVALVLHFIRHKNPGAFWILPATKKLRDTHLTHDRVLGSLCCLRFHEGAVREWYFK
jgi:hypothetical protein